ncbi:hypothetical protein OF364_01420 [Mycoplasma enhydrae]|uniref:DNA-directed RNA polymerase subunit delta n=1 Tax=Mycoplasma enhydrae TaxID=2499220 RepID=UPI00197C57DD|nr:hypothetical protein [Mycoplasma enhydrae]MBN4089289.1 hypothetical protein [Mycoplasma enhydrae]MCV3733551.1 hypothetical protein [Mycoplasma enhydrae]MCV3753473.1 hypothetical protein [Mycoplasma enhydrae]
MRENEYKTLLNIAEDILRGRKSIEFNALFDEIKEILFERWRNETDPNVNDEQLLLKKRGELYRLLTVDGKFFHNADGTWTTIRPDYKG